MRIGEAGKDGGRVQYRGVTAEDSPKTIKDLGKLALNPYSTFGKGQREGLLDTLVGLLQTDSASLAMVPDVRTAGSWLKNQDAVINGTDDKGLSALMLNDNKNYEKAALALRRLTLDEIGILPDFAKIQEMTASYAIEKAQKKASGGMIYASGGYSTRYANSRRVCY